MKKILVVDDDIQTLKYIEDILKKSDYEVISAATCFEAIDLAKENLPDLIILDIVLPDGDGGSVASSLSSYDKTSNIPIIFLTGILKKNEQELIRSKYKVLAKPTTKEELLKVVKETLSS